MLDLLGYLKQNPEALGDDAALMTNASSEALLRRQATLEQQGAEALFGEPALALEDVLQPAREGRGRIHLRDASSSCTGAQGLRNLPVVAIG